MENRQQIDEWNGALGQTWARFQDDIERVVAPLGDATLVAADPRAGERVIDVGCGCGITTIELARRVGASGRVLGVDVSRPMLEVARRRAAELGLAQLDFEEGDAARAALPAGVDLLYSRFGVMFFDDPGAALAHLRAALRPGGRAVMLAWRTPRDNPWAMAPLVAARAALGVVPEPMDPNAPGPFAFADDARVRGLLAQAGFVDVSLERRDVRLDLGESVGEAAERALRVGPTARLLREAGPAHAPAVRAAVEAALAPYADADGAVRLPGSGWIMRARSPA
jgi:SAM-dependent methyltransferase